MKKFISKICLAAALVAGGNGIANAQTKTLYLNTYNGTDLSVYDGQVRNVNVSRYLFNGWNTVCFPFSMTAEQVNAAFGDACRLETLVGVENNGDELMLNFADCKSKGIEANKPYILYYTGETGFVKILANEATIVAAPSQVSFTDPRGVVVTFAGAMKKTPGAGLYGIPAKSNEESVFVNVDNFDSGFHATRCYITLSTGNSTPLSSNHVADGEATSISSVMKNGETVDVYNLSGQIVATKISSAEISRLQKGIYVIKGKKVLVR